MSFSEVSFRASWLFDDKQSFLPVHRLALHLRLVDQNSCNTLLCVHGTCKKYLNSPNNDYCQCEQGWTGKYCHKTNLCHLKSKCAHGGECFVQNNAINCICSFGHMGIDCHARFDACRRIKCQNGGTCVPLDERIKVKFVCECSEAFFGELCQYSNAQMKIHFASMGRSLSLPVVIVHYLELRNETSGVLFTQNRLMLKQVPLDTQVIIPNEKHQYMPPFILFHLFFGPSNVDYYLAAIIKRQNVTSITIDVRPLHRCPHNKELLNETIRRMNSVKKVKYYHQICRSSTTKCFVDEAHLCFCTFDNLADCLVFQHEPNNCPIDYCQNRGRCVHHSYNGVWDFSCVCVECTHGTLCQLGTNQYVLSLDIILGTDIIEDISISKQTTLIKVTVSVAISMIVLGFFSNILSLITFSQLRTREFGCGFYLFYLPIIGQLGLLMMGGRLFYLLATQLYSIKSQRSAHYSCIILEYFIFVCPTMYDWLTTCVAVERSVNVFKGVCFCKTASVRWAKRIIPCLLIVICLTSAHEFFIWQLTEDPRSKSHPWCVVKFLNPFLKHYRLIINIVNLTVPVSINIVGTIYLLHKTTQR